MDIAERIASERKRLHMSQSAFAAAAGVSLSTQKRYEKGERGADADYLASLSRIGVDVVFLLTGSSSQGSGSDRAGLLHVLGVVQQVLDIAEGSTAREFDAAVDAAVEAHKNQWTDPAASERADRAFEHVLRRSPFLLQGLAQMEGVIEKVEFVLQAREIRLHPGAKASAIVALLRDERRTGRSADLEAVLKALEVEAGPLR